MPIALLVAAAVVAVGDWVAVQLQSRAEYVLKPATLALLAIAAATADLGDFKPLVVGALVFGLLGDVGLMLSGERTDFPFLAGLGAFLIGHVWYVVAFAVAGLDGLPLLAGLLVVCSIAGLVLPRVLRGAARSGGHGFAAVVAGYAAVLSTMAVLAVGTGIVETALGGVLFLVSDTLIARERFVAPVPRGPLLVIVTYHLAQFLIVIGLIQGG